MNTRAHLKPLLGRTATEIQHLVDNYADAELNDFLARLLRGWPLRCTFSESTPVPMEAFARPDYVADLEPNAHHSLVRQAMVNGYQPYGPPTTTWRGIPAHLAGGRPEHLNIETLPLDSLSEVDVFGPLPLGSAVVCTVSIPVVPWTDSAYEKALDRPHHQARPAWPCTSPTHGQTHAS